MRLTRGPYYISTSVDSDTSLIRQMEVTPINSEFHKFALRIFIFFLAFHYFGISLFQYFLAPFPHRKYKS